MRVCPCKGCKDRKVTIDYNCHEDCTIGYLEWLEDSHANKKYADEQRKRSYSSDSVYKHKMKFRTHISMRAED